MAARAASELRQHFHPHSVSITRVCRVLGVNSCQIILVEHVVYISADPEIPEIVARLNVNNEAAIYFGIRAVDNSVVELARVARGDTGEKTRSVPVVPSQRGFNFRGLQILVPVATAITDIGWKIPQF